MTIKIILLLAFVAIPVLLGFTCHACREDRLTQFDPARRRIVSRLVATTRGLVLAWMLFGLGFGFPPRFSSPWLVILSLAGIGFGATFCLTDSLLDWLAGRTKSPARATVRLASKGPLWDAELDYRG
jgi:hypothetical protein